MMHAIYMRNRHIHKKPYYKYYVPAVLCKLIGGTVLCLVYTFYYKDGGDATNYFLAAETYVNVLYDLNFSMFFEMLNFIKYKIHVTGYYEMGYGNIYFGNSDYYALFTVVLSIPFCLLAFKSFVGTTMLLAYVSFIGLWKLYQVFIDQFPALTKQFAIAIFFIPSVFFWGSGLLKDTYTLSALGFYTYSVYKYMILKERRFKYLFGLIISACLLIFIKPYIFFAVAPGSLIWIYFYRIAKIRNPLFKTLALPIMLLVMGLLITFALSFFGQYLGEYSLDNVLTKAVNTQQDLAHNEQYGANNYNIGDFDASISGVLAKAPAAINMALFRPYIWDARNPVMMLSGLENLFMLGFSIYILLKVKFTLLIKSLFGHPLLIFSFLFAIFFAFSVGLTTANYGALARLKIPCIPFYLSSLFIFFHLNKASFKRRML
jgi:hypothetical protein